jgi:type II secretory pathway component PulM
MSRMESLLRVLSFSSMADRDRRAILIGLAIILPAVLYVSAFRPYRALLNDTRAQLEAQRSLLARELALLAAAPTMPAKLADARTQVFRAEAQLVRASNGPLAEAQLTRYLEEQAGGSRVLLQELRSVQLTKRDEPPEGMRLLRVAMTGESDLEGVVRFLHKLETGAMLIGIRQLTLERVEPRSTTSSNARTRPRRPLNPDGVMQFTAVVEAFAPDTTSSQENP